AHPVAYAQPHALADAEPDAIADAEPDALAEPIADAEPDAIADAEPDAIAEPDALANLESESESHGQPVRVAIREPEHHPDPGSHRDHGHAHLSRAGHALGERQGHRRPGRERWWRRRRLHDREQGDPEPRRRPDPLRPAVRHLDHRSGRDVRRGRP